jgi:hypothetical protein
MLCACVRDQRGDHDRRNFGTKIFYSKIGGYMLTPFFDMSLVYDEAREVADGSWPMLKRSWPIG